jgi:alkylated DNA nucleotide flippase Atl1
MTAKVNDAPRIELERMYTYEEIAGFAGEGTTARRVRRWVEEGKLGYVQLPQGRRVLGRHWAAFIADREVSPQAAA